MTAFFASEMMIEWEGNEREESGSSPGLRLIVGGQG